MDTLVDIDDDEDEGLGFNKEEEWLGNLCINFNLFFCLVSC